MHFNFQLRYIEGNGLPLGSLYQQVFVSVNFKSNF